MYKLLVLLSIFLSTLTAAYEIENPIIISEGGAERCDEFPGSLFVSNPRGCKFYFFCTEERRGEGRCPVVDGVQLHFHAESQSCQRPEDSECGYDDQWRGLECPEFGFAKIPHPYLCDKYTVCFDGNQQDRDCPAGLEYSPFEQDCVEPELSNCLVQSDFCADTDFFKQTYFRSSRDCSEYFMCFLHVFSHWNCPEGRIFDLTVRACLPDDPDEPCVPSNPTDNDFPPIPDQSTIDCSEERHEARIAHPQSPNFWFFCHHGVSSLIPCYPSQIFDENTRTCKPNE